MLARADHLASHIDAIWSRLPDSLTGERHVDTHAQARKHWRPDDIVMVASYLDIFAAKHHRVIYVEHGAGQQYNGNGAAANYYHGGEHPDNVIGYLGPRQSVIEAWQRPGFATGCPVVDPYQLFAPEKVAAITFHYKPLAARNVPEIGTAFDHYESRLSAVIRALRDHGYEVLGHRHPRFNHLRGYWERVHGIAEASVHEVRTRAQLLIADNTSLMYEMLYLGRDVIALNAPWFRRNVEHGLRFWSHAPSVQAENPGELIELIGSINTIQNRSSDLCDLSLCDYVYGKSLSDGDDGLRGATWLTTYLASL